MSGKNDSVKEEEEDEHEEGEISDEDLPPASEEEEVKEKGSTGAEGVVSGTPSTATLDRESRPSQEGTGLDDDDDTVEVPKGEVRSGESARRADVYRVQDLDTLSKNDSGDSLRNNWPLGYSFYHVAWAEGVSGHSIFTSGAESQPVDPTSSKPASQRLSMAGLGDSGSWSTENYRKLSRRSSRDSDFYGRSSGRLSDEGDDMSPVREGVGKTGEIRTSERTDATGRGRRNRETSWSERGTSRSGRHNSIMSRIGKFDKDSMEDDGHDGVRSSGEEGRRRKQQAEPNSSKDKLNAAENETRNSSSVLVQPGELDDVKARVDDKEEGELEEGEIELGSGSDERSASPSSEQMISSRQRNYIATTATEYFKDKSYSRPTGTKTRSRPIAEDYTHRRHRQKSLAVAGDLVKNVTVKDAQKSFVDVCNRLYKALNILDDLHTSPKEGQSQEGRAESLPREFTALARQAFQGIRAVYAVRNTASGREQEQERDRNIFPRLLELANGYCQKLFTTKQARELEGMMQAVANSGRPTRVSTDKGQQAREQQLLPAPKNVDNNPNLSDPIGTQRSNSRMASAGELSKSSEPDGIERPLSILDTKQAKEAAAIAAAALAYAQNPENAARALSLHGKKDNLSVGASSVGPDTWSWPSGILSDGPFPKSAVSTVLPTTPGYNSTFGKYTAWTNTDQRATNLGSDRYSGHYVDGKITDAPAQASSQLVDVNRELSLPPGYSKVSGTYGIAQTIWEGLVRPAAMSHFAASPAAPTQTDSILSTSQGKIWALQPDASALPAYVRQLSAEFLSNVNRQRIAAAADDYERLPSPTPDEDEEVPGAPPPKDSKPNFLPKDAKILSIPSLTQDNGNEKNPGMILGSIHNLNRTQSLGHQAPALDLKASKGISQEPTAPLTAPLTSASTDGDTLQNTSIFPQKGALRSRDPRRRIQNQSVDLTTQLDKIGRDPPTTTLFREEASRDGVHKRHLVLDTDDIQDMGMAKRLKRQAESAVYDHGLIAESHHAPVATGGWLDDSADLPFATVEDTATSMELDNEGSLTTPDARQAFGVDLKVNADVSSQTFPTLLNGVGPNKRPADIGPQAMVEAGSRIPMRPRDPRRVFIDGHGEKNASSFGEKIRTDESGIMTVRKSEFSETLRKQSEGDASSKNSIQASKTQMGKLVTTAAPHLTGKLAGINGTISNSSMQPIAQNVVNLISNKMIPNIGAEGADIGMEPATGDKPGVLGEPVSSEFLNLLKSTTEPRKPRGPSSQWGASQVHPGLEQLLGDLSEEERMSVQLERQRRMEEQDRMFSAGKLCLVLDLDHTLLNSAKFSEIEPEWDQRLRVAENAERSRIGREGVGRRELYRFPHMSMWTKLRPGIWKFLARASQLYELHVYTMGNKVYATEMAKVLDPTGKLFAGRVISKGDDGDGDDLLPKSKDLDGVLGMESAVVIIDDSARVWPHHSGNLIVVERYMYFPCSRRQFGLAGPSLLEVGHDERESDGMLASALGVCSQNTNPLRKAVLMTKVIARIHESFFKNPRLREVDVRDILAAQKRQVLAGCKVVFSRVFPVGEAEPHRHPLWRTAEQFGAVCTIAIDELVTHVVAISLGTDKVNWAIETGRHVVRPAW